jgi:hypothetical protein
MLLFAHAAMAGRIASQRPDFTAAVAEAARIGPEAWIAPQDWNGMARQRLGSTRPTQLHSAAASAVQLPFVG